MFVYGTVFGGLAVQAGLRPRQVWGMSLLVLAGASQFVAVPMLAAGRPGGGHRADHVRRQHAPLPDGGASLAPAFRGFPRAWLALVAHWINDESFAVAVARRNPPDPWVYLGSAGAIGGAFLTGVPVGTQLGGLVAEPARWGLDFAFPAVFLALIAVQLRGATDWWWRWRGGGLAVAMALVLPGNWHIVIAGVRRQRGGRAGAGAGVRHENGRVAGDRRHGGGDLSHARRRCCWRWPGVRCRRACGSGCGSSRWPCCPPWRCR